MISAVLNASTFVLGFVEIYDLCQICRGKGVPTEQHPELPPWVQVAIRMAIFCAKISLVLGAAITRPGAYLTSKLAGFLHIEHLLGPHPRHTAGIAAAILALPSLPYLIYQGAQWAQKKFNPPKVQQ